MKWGRIMKQLIQSAFTISLKNWITLFAFDMVYKTVNYSILYGITTDLLNVILKTAGISYLSAENWYVILFHPSAVFLCLCLLFITALSVFFETVAIYVYCEAGWQQQRISIVSMLKQTCSHCKKLLHIQNTLLFLGFILTAILAVLPVSPYMLQWVRIPEFVMDVIEQNRLLFLIYGVVALIANLICFLFLFFLSYTLFHKKSMKAAWREGFLLLKNRKKVTLFRVLGAFLVFAAVMVMFLGIAAAGLVIYTKFVESPIKAGDTFTIYFKRAVPAVALSVGVLARVWLFSILVTLFHQYRGDDRPLPAVRANGGAGYLLKQTIIFLCGIAAILMFSESEAGGTLIEQTYPQTQIVAHRGGAAFAPENSMAALDRAITMGIDMVEIDVQQLKDGSLILLHDDNFKRTTGENKKVWEVGYDQVQAYDAGSWYSPEFAGEQVPKLEDILKREKGNIKVMIELKLTGHEENLAGEVIKLIERYDMIDQCHIGSLNLGILEEVKAVNSNIQTVYITPLIFSGQYDIGFVDAFNVETTVMTREMVVLMHESGKEVYGWTANSKDTIRKNLQCQVNGIVTDNPELVKYFMTQKWENRLLNLLLQMFFDETGTA